MSESKTSERRLEAVQKQRQALQLRLAGVPFAHIAEKLGYRSASGAFKAVSSALERTLREPADAVRKLELERLDHFLFRLWPAIQRGEPAAIGQAVKILERRAKYLGLDAPTVIATGDGDAEPLHIHVSVEPRTGRAGPPEAMERAP